MHRECQERFPRHRLQRKPLVSDLGMHRGTYRGAIVRIWQEAHGEHPKKLVVWTHKFVLNNSYDAPVIIIVIIVAVIFFIKICIISLLSHYNYHLSVIFVTLAVVVLSLLSPPSLALSSLSWVFTMFDCRYTCNYHKNFLKFTYMLTYYQNTQMGYFPGIFSIIFICSTTYCHGDRIYLPYSQAESLGPPHGDCGTTELRWYKGVDYSKSRCNRDCEVTQLVDACNCTNFYMPGKFCKANLWLNFTKADMLLSQIKNFSTRMP